MDDVIFLQKLRENLTESAAVSPLIGIRLSTLIFLSIFTALQ